MFNRKLRMNLYTCDKGYFINDKPSLQMDTPDWLRNMKSSAEVVDNDSRSNYNIGTIKNCPGINYFMTEGIKFKLWEDLKIRIYPDGSVRLLPNIPPKTEPFTQHFPLQYEGLYPNRTAFKLLTPWMGECNSDVKFMFMESHYSTNFFRENGLYIAPGYTEFKYQNSFSCHINAGLRSEPYDIEMPYGLPLFTVYPITEKKLEIKHHLITKEEYDRYSNKWPQCPVRRYYKFIQNVTK